MAYGRVNPTIGSSTGWGGSSLVLTCEHAQQDASPQSWSHNRSGSWEDTSGVNVSVYEETTLRNAFARLGVFRRTLGRACSSRGVVCNMASSGGDLSRRQDV
jgi:hypothetical protein